MRPRTRPRRVTGEHLPCACASMVADVELSAAGNTRRPGRADGSGARDQKTASPAARVLSKHACRELCVEGGGGLRAATTGRCWLPPPLPVHLVLRALPRTPGRAPPAGRSAHPVGGFHLQHHKCPDNQLGLQAANTSHKCLGGKKVGSVGVQY